MRLPEADAMIRNIQALRALAAYLVVFVHLDALILLAGGPQFGNGGVDVFFVISGYIMVHVTRTSQASPGGFLLHRIARVAPLYWVLTVAVFLIAAIAPSIFKNTSADPLQLLMSLFFIPFQKAATGGPQPILFVGWTLNYEMFFYGLFALGLFARKREHGTLAVMGVLLALVAAGLVARPTATLPAFYGSPLILEFAAGMALALALPHMPEKAGRWGQAAVLAVGALALLMLVNAPAWRVTHALIYGPPATVLVAAALLLERWGRSLDNRLVQLLGDASYSVYLTHVFVTIAVTRLSVQLGVSGWTAAAAFLVALFGVTALGLATHLLIDRLFPRAMRLLRYAIGDLAAPAATGMLTVLQSISGRRNVQIDLIDGTIVHSEAFTHAVRDLPGMRTHQIVRRSAGLLPLIRIEASETLPAPALAALRERLFQVHPLLADVVVERTDFIPPSLAGKHQMVVKES